MAEGEVGAVFEGLAKDAAEAGEGLAESIAKVSDKVADIEEANLVSLEAADAKAAQLLDAAGRDDAPGTVAPAGAPLETGIPLGFSGPGEYDTFVNTLNRGLADAGFADTEAAFQGTSVTGVSYAKGLPFRPGSDYDIAVGGPDIFSRAKDLGIPLRAGGTRTGPLTPDQIQALGLTGLREQLRTMANRNVEFMIYPDIDTAVARRPSVRVPPGERGAG
jgi:hypothetical protein